MAIQSYIHTNNVQEFPLLHIMDNTWLIFLIIVILTGVKWHLIKNLICIALMINDAENIFTYLLTICTLSLEKCLFRFSANFLIWVFGLFWLCVLFFFVWVYFAVELYVWSYWAQVIAGKAVFSLKAQEENLFNCYFLL